MQDELGFEPKHPVAGSSELAITPTISGGTRDVHAPVDFDDQALGGSQKVHDSAFDDDLALEGHAWQLTKPEPEPEVGIRGRGPHTASPGGEQELTASGALQ